MVGHDRPWRILFVGGGVIGSIYAARFVQAGHHVTVLDRGQRLRDIREHGLVLQPALGGLRVVVSVATVEALEADDRYDLVVVPVRNDQIRALLPMLAANLASPNFLFMVNNPSGYDQWRSAVGDERLLLGFPGAGGTVEGPTVRYHIVSGLLQPTTLGEPDGRITPRLRAVRQLMRAAGFPVSLCRNMNAWQKYHVAWVTPCAYAVYYAVDHGLAVGESRDAWQLAVQAIREGFAALRTQGFPVTPGKLRLLELIPETLLVRMFQAWARTAHFDSVAAQHSLNARDEMSALARQLTGQASLSRRATPALRALCERATMRTAERSVSEREGTS
jgi:2-dehydropantoate 2-reductase